MPLQWAWVRMLLQDLCILLMSLGWGGEGMSLASCTPYRWGVLQSHMHNKATDIVNTLNDWQSAYQTVCS